MAEREEKGKEAEEGQVWGRCMRKLKWEEARVPCVFPSYKWYYKWHRSSCGSESFTSTTASVSGNVLFIEGLLPGTEYSYRVAAMNEAGRSNFTE